MCRIDLSTLSVCRLREAVGEHGQSGRILRNTGMDISRSRRNIQIEVRRTDQLLHRRQPLRHEMGTMDTSMMIHRSASPSLDRFRVRLCLRARIQVHGQARAAEVPTPT